MGKTAILSLRIIADATAGIKGLDDTANATDRLGATMDKASVGAGVALGGLFALASKAGDAASELQQAAGGVESVFGAYASSVNDFASKAAQDVGLSTSAYSNMATIIGSQLKNMGVDLGTATGQTQDLIARGADLAATFGGTTSDAVEAISSLLRGERDPIERYGVSMNQAAVNAEKAALGLSGLTGEADKNATLQATLSLLTKQTSAATGQFGREADTAAGQQQRANAEWENALAILGTQLLPVMSAWAMHLADVAQWVSQNSELVTFLAVVVGGLALGILAVNGALKAYAAAQAIATAAQWAYNAAADANPIGVAIILLGIIIGVIVLLATHWDDVRGRFEDGWNAIKSGAADVIRFLQPVLDFIGRISAALGGIGFSGLSDLVAGDVNLRAAVAVQQPAQQQQQTFMRSFAAVPEMTSLAVAPAASLSTAGRLAAPAAQQQQAGDTYNFTINGAIDKDGTARSIQRVLEERDTRNGTRSAGTTRTIR